MWYKYEIKSHTGAFYGITAFMKLLPCIIFVNTQLYEMLYDDVQLWGGGG